MNKKCILAAAAFSLAAAVSTVNAQTVTTNLGDLVLGFYASSGTGASSSLEVDLGSITNYVDSSGNPLGGSTMFQVTNLSATDLTAVYGSTWNTRSDLSWGIIGTVGRTGTGPLGEPVATLWATNAETTAGTQSNAWLVSSSSGQKSVSSKLESVITANFSAGGLNGAAATANSAFSAVIDNSLSNSYKNEDTSVAGTSFGYFNPSIDNFTNFGSSTWIVSDLYELRSSTSNPKPEAVYVGSFGLNAEGQLYFASSASAFATAVPEPATYAAIIGALSLGLVVIRRRRQAAAA